MFQKFAKSLASSLGLGGSQNRDEDRFLLTSKQEILAVLKDVRDSGTFVTVQLVDAGENLLTTLLAVSESGLVLDYGANEAMNRKALASRQQTFLSDHFKVKIHFSATGLKLATFQGRPAFLAALPGSLVRLQRRENYRLPIPAFRPVRCVFPSGSNGLFQQGPEAMVLNISNGGIAVLSPPRGLVLSLGSTHRNCRIVLPDAGDIRTTMQVKNVSDLIAKGGKQGKRVGCQFMDLDRVSLNLIQRYILENDRELRARESGM